jgi:hypothetical protein
MSWNVRGAGGFVGEELRQCCFEFQNSGGGHIPDFFQIDADVIVYEDVAHAADGLPIQPRQISPRRGGDRFAASPITSTLRITASCNASDSMNAVLPGAMKRVMRWQRSSM